MSYLTLLKLHGIQEFYHHMISMGGTTYIPIERYLEQNPNIKSLILCLDSDDEGNFFSQKIREKFGDKYSRIARHIPKGKDFNEELVGCISNLSFYNDNESLENNMIKVYTNEEVIL